MEEEVGGGGVIGGATAVVDVLTLLVSIAVVLFERDEEVALEETFRGDQGEVPFEIFERFAFDVALEESFARVDGLVALEVLFGGGEDDELLELEEELVEISDVPEVEMFKSGDAEEELEMEVVVLSMVEVVLCKVDWVRVSRASLLALLAFRGIHMQSGSAEHVLALCSTLHLDMKF